jgi:hypothetical protein
MGRHVPRGVSRTAFQGPLSMQERGHGAKLLTYCVVSVEPRHPTLRKRTKTGHNFSRSVGEPYLLDYKKVCPQSPIDSDCQLCGGANIVLEAAGVSLCDSRDLMGR